MATGIIVVSAGSLSASSGATSLAPAKPTVSNITGSLGILIARCSSKNNATHSTATAGWTQISQTNSGTGWTTSIYWALESAGAPTISWTGSVACEAMIYYLTAPDNRIHQTVPIGASSTSTGSGTTITTTSINTTKTNSTVLHLLSHAANAAPAHPSSWTSVNNGNNGTAAIGYEAAYLQMGASGSASGATSVSVGTTGAWVGIQLEILPSEAAANSIDFAKVESDAWYSPPNDNLEISKAEGDAWYTPHENNLDISKVEGSLWMDNTPSAWFSKVEMDIWYHVPLTGRRRQMWCSLG